MRNKNYNLFTKKIKDVVLLVKKNLVPSGIIMASIIISLFLCTGKLNFAIYSNSTVTWNNSLANSLAASIFNGCQKEHIGTQDCYKNKLSTLTGAYGLANSTKILTSLQDIDEGAKNCHVIAHYMAREAYKRNPYAFDSLIEEVDVNSCGSGFLHGVLEAYSGDHPEIPIDGAFATEICGRGNDEYRHRMCAHFMGHILLLNAYGNLSEALPLCESVQDSWKFDCYNGLFMEDHQKLTLAEHGITPLPPNDAPYIAALEEECNKHGELIGRACWTEMAEVYAHTYGYMKPAIIYNECYKAPNEDFARSCYSKGVTALSVFKGYDSKEALLGLCSFYVNKKGNDYYNCIHNIVASIMYYTPKYVTRGVTLCSSVAENYQNECFTHLSYALRTASPLLSERTQFCKNLPETYQERCLN